MTPSLPKRIAFVLLSLPVIPVYLLGWIVGLIVAVAMGGFVGGSKALDRWADFMLGLVGERN